MNLFRKLIHNENGGVAVEFAFAIPILVVMMLMVIDLGRGIFAYSTLNSASADAVRYASVHGLESIYPRTDQQIIDFARSRAVGFDDPNLTVRLTWNPSGYSGGQVEVVMLYDFTFFVSGLIGIPPTTLGGKAALSVM